MVSFQENEIAKRHDVMTQRLKPLLDIVRNFSAGKRIPLDSEQTEQLARIIIDSFQRREDIAKIEPIDHATSIEIAGLVEAYCSGANKAPDANELNALLVQLSLAVNELPRGQRR